MPYTITQARKLLSATELVVFDASRTQMLRELTPARLRAKTARSRTLRDKYRDLYRRQTVSTRAKAASLRSPVGGDNERTRQKAELFAEALTRFETALKRVDAEQKAAAKAKARLAQEKEKAKLAKARAKAKAATPKAAIPKTAARAAAKQSPPPGRAPVQPRAARKTAALDATPKTERGNPLRTKAGNLAIHAHQRSAGRRVQAKRDAR